MKKNKQLDFEPFKKEVALSSSAFSHPLRIEIYRYILKNNAKLIKVKNKDITEKFGYSQSTISEHLSKLVSGGLIKSKKNGTLTIYYANAGFVSEYIKKLDSLARLIEN